MNGRLVILPSRSEIFFRSISYGAAWGAATGGLAVVVPAVFAGPFVPGALILAMIAAAVGAVVGVACGLTAGLGLVILRRHIGTSRCAVRVVAGCGAGLLPATWLVALAANSGQLWPSVPFVMTVVTVVLASALGPYAYYGSPRRRRRRTRRPSSVRRES
jgi:hypothetical protein